MSGEALAAPASPIPVTRAEFDRAVCSVCGKVGCDGEKNIRAVCHPPSPLRAAYVPTGGFLRLSCAICGQMVLHIQVAWAVPS